VKLGLQGRVKIFAPLKTTDIHSYAIIFTLISAVYCSIFVFEIVG
jgi:hypothetical protein